MSPSYKSAGLITALLAATSAAPLCGQGVVRGVLREASGGRPVSSASVVLAGTPYQTATDQTGAFVLRDVPAGTYQLRARRIGYRPVDRAVVLAGTDMIIVDISVEAIAIALADIVVTPSRFGVADDRAVATATLTRDDVATLPQLGEDVYRAIQRLPGLASYDYTARFWIRGAPNEEVLARFDGVELLEPFHLKDLDAALSIVDIETVGRLNLTTGGFTVDYGDRLAGVLELETLAPGDVRPRTTLGLSISNFRASSQGQFAGGRGRWVASARRGYLDIILRLVDANEDLDPRYYDLGAKVEYQLGLRHVLSIHGLRAGDRLSILDDDAALESSYGSTYGWLRWRGTFGESVRSDAVLSVARHNWRREANGLLGQNNPFLLHDVRNLTLAGLRQDWSAALGERFAMRWGYDLRDGSADYVYFAWRDRSFLQGDSIAVIRDTTAAALAPSGKGVGAYVAPRVRPFGPVTLEAGVRYDYHEWDHAGTWSPRVHLAYSLGRATLRGAWGLYHQAQGLHQVAVQDRDTAFYQPERAEHRVLGVEYQAGQGIVVRVEAYERKSSYLRPHFVNLSDYTDVLAELRNDRARLEPIRGRARGIEVLAERRIGTRLGWSVSYALASTEEDLAGTLVPRLRDQRHTFAADFNYVPNAKWRLSWAWQYHTGWPFTEQSFTIDTLSNRAIAIIGAFGPVNAVRLTPYHRLDLRATRRFDLGKSVLRVFVDLFNTYGRANINGFDYGIDTFTGRVSRSGQELLPRLPTFGASWEF